MNNFFFHARFPRGLFGLSDPVFDAAAGLLQPGHGLFKSFPGLLQRLGFLRQVFGTLAFRRLGQQRARGVKGFNGPKFIFLGVFNNGRNISLQGPALSQQSGKILSGFQIVRGALFFFGHMRGRFLEVGFRVFGHAGHYLSDFIRRKLALGRPGLKFLHGFLQIRRDLFKHGHSRLVSFDCLFVLLLKSLEFRSRLTVSGLIHISA